MSQLRRITTEYVDTEDRLRITGSLDGDAAVEIWITFRFVQRLLPPLFQWLEKQGGDLPRMEALQSFAQQKATAQMTREAPVRAGENSRSWLVTSVDLQRGNEAVRLNFKGKDGSQAALTMTPKMLRQWLAIVHAAYRKAGWPRDAWPEWMEDSVAPRAPQGVVLH